MIKVDKLNSAIDNLQLKVNAREYTSGSSYEDIACGLVSYLRAYTGLISRDGEKSENKAVLRQYFNAVNNYIGILDQNSNISKKETRGDIMGSQLNCALPEVRNMTPHDANDLGFNSSKLAYIWSLDINAKSIEESLAA